MHQQEYPWRCSPLRASDEDRVQCRTGGWPPVPGSRGTWKNNSSVQRAVALQDRHITRVASPCDQCSLPAGVPAWRVRRMTAVGYKIRGRQTRKARTGGPFLGFSESYCFGSGSEPKFAWTNVHLSPFFTKTRVDFARAGSFFPSLSCVTPT